ncbi:activating signal cointegrator 1 complex subunit 2 [Pelomyxa schiedti]|nr:activating signal cointegrator 1 complex subunit 2 [Pelomyxa schiedti]
MGKTKDKDKSNTNKPNKPSKPHNKAKHNTNAGTAATPTQKAAATTPTPSSATKPASGATAASTTQPTPSSNATVKTAKTAAQPAVSQEATPTKTGKQIAERQAALKEQHEIELEEKIKLHEREKKTSPLPLEQSFTLVANSLGELDRVPDVHKKWVDRSNGGFLPYLFEDSALVPLSTGTSQESANETLQHVMIDASGLLHMSYKQFWSTVVYDDSLVAFIDSFLRHFRRPWDSHTARETKLNTTINREILSLMFRVLLRLGTNKESPTNFMGKEYYAQLVLQHHLWDIPKILDLCAIYAARGGKTLETLVRTLFTLVPALYQSLDEMVPTILKVFQVIEQHPLPKLPEDSPDMALYLLDTAATLASFLRVYPHASHIFQKHAAFQAIARCYMHTNLLHCAAAINAEEMPGAVGNELQFVLDSAMPNLYRCLLSVALVVFQHFYVENLSGQYRGHFSTYCDFCKESDLLQIGDSLLGTLEAVSQTNKSSANDFSSVLDSMIAKLKAPVKEIDFVKDFQEIFPIHRWLPEISGKVKMDQPRVDNMIKFYASIAPVVPPAKSPSPDSTATRSGSSETPTETAAAPTSSSTTSQADEGIKQIRDLFPDLTIKLVRRYLSENGNNPETVISRLVEGTLPSSTAPSRAHRGKRPLLEDDEVWAPRLKEKVLALYYNDDYDDSLDDFMKYQFNDGEALNNDESSESSGEEITKSEDEESSEDSDGSEDSSTSEEAPSTRATPPQQPSSNAVSPSPIFSASTATSASSAHHQHTTSTATHSTAHPHPRGGSHGKAAHLYKSHHRKERAAKKQMMWN